MDGRITVDLPDGIQQLFCGAVFLQQKLPDFDAHFGAALHGAGFIGDIIGTFAHTKDRQSRGYVFRVQSGSALCQHIGQGVCGAQTFQELCHVSLPF